MSVEEILAGNIRAAARLMRDLDDRRPDAIAALKALFPHTGRAYMTGITGNPGAGKSTVVDALIAHYRAAGERVGVVCVDPTSPFSGGAILGDRIRMQRHALDPGVFIKSLATRGHLGGLSRSTFDVVHVLDAMGFPRILVETVGVGQDEVDVMRAAHTTVVVTVPGLGDDIQAIKSGLLEVADVLVVNKADREGADRTAAEVESLLGLHAYREGEWRPTIVRTVATTGQGLDDLADDIARFRTQSATIESRRRDRARTQLRAILAARLMEQITSRVTDMEMETLADRIAARTIDPYTAAEQILGEMEPRAARGEGAPARDAARSGARSPRDKR